MNTVPLDPLHTTFSNLSGTAPLDDNYRNWRIYDVPWEDGARKVVAVRLGTDHSLLVHKNYIPCTDQSRNRTRQAVCRMMVCRRITHIEDFGYETYVDTDPDRVYRHAFPREW